MKKKKVNSIDALINDEMIEKIETNKSDKLYGGDGDDTEGIICEWYSQDDPTDCYVTIQDQVCGGGY